MTLWRQRSKVLVRGNNVVSILVVLTGLCKLQLKQTNSLLHLFLSSALGNSNQIPEAQNLFLSATGFCQCETIGGGACNGHQQQSGVSLQDAHRAEGAWQGLQRRHCWPERRDCSSC